MAKKKSWVSLVKRFFLLETHSKPEKVDSLGLEYVCGKSSSITQLISSTRFIFFIEGQEERMGVCKAVQSKKFSLH